MPDDNVDFCLLHPEPLLVVISGPSGVGKDAVLRELKEPPCGLPLCRYRHQPSEAGGGG